MNDADADESSGRTAELSSAPQIKDVEIIELIGSGPMSRIYKAKQTFLDRIIIVKVLSRTCLPDEKSYQRFLAEAKLTSSLEHPNIVATLGFGAAIDGQPYILLEYLQGRTLADEFRERSAINMGRFRGIFVPLLAGLAYAHERGILHRDIKPSNIMICRHDDGQEFVKLLDFGIAKVLTEASDNNSMHLTQTGVLIGSPAYMSPEQCQGKALDARSDLYSFCCVMYEALCGELPFQGNSSLEIMHKHLTQLLPTAANLSSERNIPLALAKIILKGMEKEPADRPSSAAELLAKLRLVLDDVTLDRVPGNKAGASKKNALNSAVIVAAVVILFLAFGSLALKMRSKSDSFSMKPTSSASQVWLARKQTLEDEDELKQRVPDGKKRIKYYKQWLLQHQTVELRQRVNAEFALARNLVAFHDPESNDFIKLALDGSRELTKNYKVPSENRAKLYLAMADFSGILGNQVDQKRFRQSAIKDLRLCSEDNVEAVINVLRDSGRSYHSQKNYDEEYSVLLERYRLVQKHFNNSNKQELVWVLNDLTFNQLGLDNFASARNYLSKSEQILEKSTDGVIGWYFVTDAYFTLGDDLHVAQIADKLWAKQSQAAHSPEQSGELVRVLIDAGRAEERQKHIDLARSYIDRAINLAAGLQDRLESFEALCWKLKFCADQHDEKDVAVISERILDFVGNKVAMHPAVILNAGKICLQTGAQAQTKLVLRKTLDALAKAPPNADVPDCVADELTLADIALIYGATLESKELLEDMIRRLEVCGYSDTDYMVCARIAYANYFMQIGDWKKCEQEIRNIESLKTPLSKIPPDSQLNFYAIGIACYTFFHDLDKAAKYIDLGNKIVAVSPNCQILFFLGTSKFYLARGQVEKALNCDIDAFHKTNFNGFLFEAARAYSLLGDKAKEEITLRRALKHPSSGSMQQIADVKRDAAVALMDFLRKENRQKDAEDVKQQFGIK